MANAPKVNPLQSVVNSTVASNVQPYLADLKNVNSQYGNDIATENQGGAALQGQLSSITNQAQSDNANLLALAQQRASGGQQQMAANQSFLQNILGNYMGNGMSLQQAEQASGAQQNAGNVQNAAGLDLAARAQGSNLATMAGAATLQQQQDIANLTSQQQGARNQYQGVIAGIRSQAPALMQKLQQQQFENQMAQDQLGLSRAQQAEAKREFGVTQGFNQQQLSDQLASQYAQAGLNPDGSLNPNSPQAADLNARNQAATAKNTPSRYLPNLDAKQWDPVIDAVLSSFSAVAGTKSGQPVKDANGNIIGTGTKGSPGVQFQSAYQTLTAKGMAGKDAALLALRWTTPLAFKGLKGGILQVMGDLHYYPQSIQHQVMAGIYGKTWQKQLQKAATSKYENQPIKAK